MAALAAANVRFIPVIFGGGHQPMPGKRAGRAGRADIREGQHTLGVCQTGIRFCRVFDDRQRAVAAPSC